jgi:hypothetical protein
MISFLAIGSREENFAMGERRLGWNEEGDSQGSVYKGVHLVARVKILSLEALYKGICEWTLNICDLIMKECRKGERVDGG